MTHDTAPMPFDNIETTARELLLMQDYSLEDAQIAAQDAPDEFRDELINEIDKQWAVHEGESQELKHLTALQDLNTRHGALTAVANEQAFSILLDCSDIIDYLERDTANIGAALDRVHDIADAARKVIDKVKES